MHRHNYLCLCLSDHNLERVDNCLKYSQFLDEKVNSIFYIEDLNEQTVEDRDKQIDLGIISKTMKHL